jgi:hypothetical protein
MTLIEAVVGEMYFISEYSKKMMEEHHLVDPCLIVYSNIFSGKRRWVVKTTSD